MSLAIQVDEVAAVLLPDGWHTVWPETFAIDSYEFLVGDFLLLGGGQSALITSAGFTFEESLSGVGNEAHRGQTTVGPLTSVLAVKLRDS